MRTHKHGLVAPRHRLVKHIACRHAHRFFHAVDIKVSLFLYVVVMRFRIRVLHGVGKSVWRVELGRIYRRDSLRFVCEILKIYRELVAARFKRISRDNARLFNVSSDFGHVFFHGFGRRVSRVKRYGRYLVFQNEKDKVFKFFLGRYISVLRVSAVVVEVRGVVPRFVVFRKIYDCFCFRDFVYFRRYLIFAAVRRLKRKGFARRIILVVDVPFDAFDVGFCGRKSCRERYRFRRGLAEISCHTDFDMVCGNVVLDDEINFAAYSVHIDF